MNIRLTITKLKNLVHRGEYLLIAAVLVAAFGTNSLVFALPTPTTGDITGIVTNREGVALSGIKIDAYIPHSNTSSVGFTISNADGTYDISGLAPGSYTVQFNNQPGAGDSGLYYTTQWYDNQINSGDTTATPVNVTAGVVTPNINDVLAPAGVIAGKITDNNGNGLDAIKVNAYVPDSQAAASGFTMTRPDGMYYMNVPAGSYQVQFNNMPEANNNGAYYAAQRWYDNQPSPGTPNIVTVTNGTTTPDINATLAPAGAVSGRVVDESGKGIANIGITAYASLDNYNNPNGRWWTVFVFTDENGYYFMGGVPAGSSYILDFNGPSGDPYHPEQWYSGKATADTATLVAVTNNVTTPNVNVTLQSYGAVSGKVVDTTGAPARSYVSAYATRDDFYNNTPAASMPVNADGSYTMYGLTPGTYYIYFAPLPGYITVPQFYNSQPTIRTATKVTVTKEAITPDVNATLAFLSQSAGSLITYSNKFQPACMGPIQDVLPGICEAAFAGLPTSAKADVLIWNKDHDPKGIVMFSSEAASHTLKLTSKAIARFYVFGTNNASAAAQGMATVTVDGVTTTNPFRVIATDGRLVSSKTKDQFGIFIWAPGANPNTDQPLYYMNEPLTNGNVIVKG